MAIIDLGGAIDKKEVDKLLCAASELRRAPTVRATHAELLALSDEQRSTLLGWRKLSLRLHGPLPRLLSLCELFGQAKPLAFDGLSIENQGQAVMLSGDIVCRKLSLANFDLAISIASCSRLELSYCAGDVWGETTDLTLSTSSLRSMPEADRICWQTDEAADELRMCCPALTARICSIAGYPACGKLSLPNCVSLELDCSILGSLESVNCLSDSWDGHSYEIEAPLLRHLRLSCCSASIDSTNALLSLELDRAALVSRHSDSSIISLPALERLSLVDSWVELGDWSSVRLLEYLWTREVRDFRAPALVGMVGKQLSNLRELAISTPQKLDFAEWSAAEFELDRLSLAGCEVSYNDAGEPTIPLELCGRARELDPPDPYVAYRLPAVAPATWGLRELPPECPTLSSGPFAPELPEPPIPTTELETRIARFIWAQSSNDEDERALSEAELSSLLQELSDFADSPPLSELPDTSPPPSESDHTDDSDPDPDFVFEPFDDSGFFRELDSSVSYSTSNNPYGSSSSSD